MVQEYETNQGALTEISRNYYAVNRKTGDLYYFGEEVDMYRDGRVFSHGGSWRAGIRNAKVGVMMPGNPAVPSQPGQQQPGQPGRQQQPGQQQPTQPGQQQPTQPGQQQPGRQGRGGNGGSGGSGSGTQPSRSGQTI